MMMKKNLFNISTALGLLFCPLVAQAMEKQEDRTTNNIAIAKLKKDIYVFDHCALNHVTSRLFGENVFPKEIIYIISSFITDITEDFFRDITKIDSEEFKRSLCRSKFTTNLGSIHIYTNHPYEMSKENHIINYNMLDQLKDKKNL